MFKTTLSLILCFQLVAVPALAATSASQDLWTTGFQRRKALLNLKGYSASPQTDSPEMRQIWLSDFQRRMAMVAPEFQREYSGLRSRLMSKDVQERTGAAVARIKSSPKAVAQSMAHNFTTVLTIWLASIIIAVDEQRKAAARAETSINKEELNQNLAEVSSAALNNFELYAGLLGGGAFGTLLAVPLKGLSALMTHKVSAPIFRKLINSGLSSLVVFVGFEFFRHLWRAAIMQLDASEISQAQNLKVSRILSGQADDQEKALFSKVVQHAWTIITFGDPEVGDALVYDTWRLSLATGEFATLLVAMVASGVAAGEVGSALGTIAAPGYGTAIGWVSGLIGGVAGAVIAHAMPEQVKTPITHAFRAGRSRAAMARSHTNESELRRIVSYFARPLGPALPDYQLKELKGFLKERANYRNDFMTAQFETIHSHFLQTLQLTAELKAVQRLRGEQSEPYKRLASELAPLQEKARSEITSAANRAIDFYLGEIEALNGLGSAKLPAEFKNEFEKHIAMADFQLQFLISLLSGFEPRILENSGIVAVAPDMAVFEEYLNGIYLFGYRESSIYELLGKAS